MSSPSLLESANDHFAGGMEKFPMPFKAHAEEVIRRAEKIDCLFPDLGAMTIVSSIHHWGNRALLTPKITGHLETLSEQLSNLELPRMPKRR